MIKRRNHVQLASIKLRILNQWTNHKRTQRNWLRTLTVVLRPGRKNKNTRMNLTRFIEGHWWKSVERRHWRPVMGVNMVHSSSFVPTRLLRTPAFELCAHAFKTVDSFSLVALDWSTNQTPQIHQQKRRKNKTIHNHCEPRRGDRGLLRLVVGAARF